MSSRSDLAPWAKIALPLLVALLAVYRRYLAGRPGRRRDPTPRFERQYEPIEPRSEVPDLVRGTGDLVLRFNQAAKLLVLVVFIAFALFAVREPIVRSILAVTAITILAVAAVAMARRRERGGGGPAR